MKLPKCKKTITGKHNFIHGKWNGYEGRDKLGNLWTTGNYFDPTIKCVYCGLVDDRKK